MTKARPSKVGAVAAEPEKEVPPAELFAQFLNAAAPDAHGNPAFVAAFDRATETEKLKKMRDEVEEMQATSVTEIVAKRRELDALGAELERIGSEHGTSRLDGMAGKRWTETFKSEVAEYRQKYGTRAAAKHFSVSEQLIRRRLPNEQGKKPASLWSGLGKA